MENQEAWSLLVERVKGQDFSLESIKLVKVDLTEMVISSPTPSTLLRVKKKYLPLIFETWKDITGESVSVKAIKRDAARVAKVVDDGVLIKRRATALMKFSGQKLSSDRSSDSVLPIPTAEDLLRKAFSKLSNKVRLEVISSAIKEFYGLEDIRFILPKAEGKYRKPRMMAILLSKLYLDEKSNREITAYFGVTINAILVAYQKAKRASMSEPDFKKAFLSIKNSLRLTLHTKP